jgi:hypothetical protein
LKEVDEISKIPSLKEVDEISKIFFLEQILLGLTQIQSIQSRQVATPFAAN